jgi:hypothetical protein
MGAAGPHIAGRVCDTAALSPYIGSSDDAAAVHGELCVRGLVGLSGDASLRPPDHPRPRIGAQRAPGFDGCLDGALNVHGTPRVEQRRLEAEQRRRHRLSAAVGEPAGGLLQKATPPHPSRSVAARTVDGAVPGSVLANTMPIRGQRASIAADASRYCSISQAFAKWI